MSKITITRLSRSILKDGRIVGHKPPQKRNAYVNPLNKNQFVLLSVGQRFNWGKALSRKNIIYKLK